MGGDMSPIESKEPRGRRHPLSFLKRPFKGPGNLVPAYGTGAPAGPDVSSTNNADANPNVSAITQIPKRPKTPSGGRDGTGNDPTQEEAKDANAGGLAPRGLARVLENAANHPLIAGGIVITAAGISAGIANRAAIIRSVDTLGQGVADRWNSLRGDEVPSTFDNNPESAKFGENNIRKITPQEAEKENLLEPKVRIDETGTVIVTTLIPGILPSIIPDIDLKTKVVSPRGKGIDYMPPFVNKTFSMPEGFQLTIPKGAHYALILGDPKANPNQSSDSVHVVIAIYFDKELNLTFLWTFGTDRLIPGDNQKTIDWKTYNGQYNPSFGGRDGKYTQLPLSDGITPVASPAYPNQPLSVHLSATSGSDLTPETLGPNREELFRKVLLENYVGGKKLIVLSRLKR